MGLPAGLDDVLEIRGFAGPEQAVHLEDDALPSHPRGCPEWDGSVICLPKNKKEKNKKGKNKR